jgi:hypothetical protein
VASALSNHRDIITSSHTWVQIIILYTWQILTFFFFIVSLVTTPDAKMGKLRQRKSKLLPWDQVQGSRSSGCSLLFPSRPYYFVHFKRIWKVKSYMYSTKIFKNLFLSHQRISGWCDFFLCPQEF